MYHKCGGSFYGAGKVIATTSVSINRNLHPTLLSPAHIRISLDLLKKTHYYLNFKISERSGLQFVPNTKDIPQKIHLDCEERDWELVCHKESNSPFLEDENGDINLLAVSIVQSKDTITIIFSLHHAICDGITSISLLGDFLRLWTGNKIQDRPISNLIRPIAMQTVLWTLIPFYKNVFYILRGLWQHFLQKRPPISILLNKESFRPTSAELQQGYPYQFIDNCFLTANIKVDMNILKKRCKEHNVTINSFLVACFLQNVWREFNENSSSTFTEISIAVNMRNRLPQSSLITSSQFLIYYVTVLETLFSKREWEKGVPSLWNLAELVHLRVSQELNEHKTKLYGKVLALDLFWKIIMEDILQSKLEMGTFEVSNVGDCSDILPCTLPIQLPDLSNEQLNIIDARIINPVPHWKSVLFHVLSIRDTFCLSINFPARVNELEEKRKFTEKIQRLLKGSLQSISENIK